MVVDRVEVVDVEVAVGGATGDDAGAVPLTQRRAQTSVDRAPEVVDVEDGRAVLGEGDDLDVESDIALRMASTGTVPVPSASQVSPATV